MVFPPGIYILIIITFLFVLLLSGAWIQFSLYGVALFALMFLGRGDMQGILGSLLFNSINSYSLVALPLFIFMGELLIKSESSTPLFRGVRKILGPFPGGMLHSNIFACSVFAACSGSSTATTLAIGGVAYPELIKAGYDRKITLGSIAAGGTLGILIPPSIMMIIFGSITGNSVGKLFIGGLIPGIILALLFMAWIVIASIVHPSWMPGKTSFGRDYLRNFLSGLKDILPIVFLIGFIMGSIYGGFATPTEAAAVASVVCIFIVGVVYKKLSWKVIKESLEETIFLTSMMMICVVGARALGMALSMLQIAQWISNVVSSLTISRYIIWALIVLIYMVLGCLIDGFDLMLVTTPVFYPIVVNTLKFDPIWFGVVLVIILEMSLITPPVGFNLYVTHTLGGRKNLMDTIIGLFPFLIMMLVSIAIFTAFPNLVLYLPTHMK